MSIITAPRPDERLAGTTGAMSSIWFKWVSRVTSAVGGREPAQLAGYTVASLPDPARWPRCVVYVSNDVGGSTLAFSDGSDWRRMADRAIITT